MVKVILQFSALAFHTNPSRTLLFGLSGNGQNGALKSHWSSLYMILLSSNIFQHLPTIHHRTDTLSESPSKSRAVTIGPLRKIMSMSSSCSRGVQLKGSLLDQVHLSPPAFLPTLKSTIPALNLCLEHETEMLLMMCLTEATSRNVLTPS